MKTPPSNTFQPTCSSNIKYPNIIVLGISKYIRLEVMDAFMNFNPYKKREKTMTPIEIPYTNPIARFGTVMLLKSARKKRQKQEHPTKVLIKQDLIT